MGSVPSKTSEERSGSLPREATHERTASCQELQARCQALERENAELRQLVMDLQQSLPSQSSGHRSGSRPEEQPPATREQCVANLHPVGNLHCNERAPDLVIVATTTASDVAHQLGAYMKTALGASGTAAVWTEPECNLEELERQAISATQ
ncbi:hypothetical protein CYMTET_52459 [Cymbomonas tetramitiformis]|uniref:Uncharacterized protein n=1 Tax=Cymbomonas tetramitiformis TaxID=36881 RepID=A0AAE0BKD8_9CHLO|nr:hypothetical protein CYMTET_52459 [Cymbomonas tetramitiformis]